MPTEPAAIYAIRHTAFRRDARVYDAGVVFRATVDAD